jgi:hypothetical protein
MKRHEHVSKDNLVAGAYFYTDEQLEKFHSEQKKRRKILRNLKNPVLRAVLEFIWDMKQPYIQQR